MRKFTIYGIDSNDPQHPWPKLLDGDQEAPSAEEAARQHFQARLEFIRDCGSCVFRDVYAVVDHQNQELSFFQAHHGLQVVKLTDLASA